MITDILKDIESKRAEKETLIRDIRENASDDDSICRLDNFTMKDTVDDYRDAVSTLHNMNERM